jgi:hypothetical protein
LPESHKHRDITTIPITIGIIVPIISKYVILLRLKV